MTHSCIFSDHNCERHLNLVSAFDTFRHVNQQLPLAVLSIFHVTTQLEFGHQGPGIRECHVQGEGSPQGGGAQGSGVDLNAFPTSKYYCTKKNNQQLTQRPGTKMIGIEIFPAKRNSHDSSTSSLPQAFQWTGGTFSASFSPIKLFKEGQLYGCFMVISLVYGQNEQVGWCGDLSTECQTNTLDSHRSCRQSLFWVHIIFFPVKLANVKQSGSIALQHKLHPAARQ